MLLKTRLSNKTKLRKLIASVIQFLNTNNKKNIVIFVSRIKEKKYLIREIQTIDIKKEKATKRQKKIIYNNKII